MAEVKQPNILFVMADQMAAPLLSMYNSASPVKTPTLDRLAKGGVVFESAYCNSPLCAPSRFSLVTGQLPSKIGGYDNASNLGSDIPTYAHYLRKEGYHTALSGKMHFCGPDQLHGFEQRLTTDIYPGDYGWTVNWDEPEVRPDWFHNMSSVLEAGPVVRTNQLDFDDDVIHKSIQYLYDHVRHRTNQPFCLTVSMTHPHDPYAMTKEYWDMYEGVEIPLPKTPAIPHDQQDPHSQRLLKVIDLYGKEMPEEKIQAARRAYFAACTYVDSQVEKLLRTLNNCGLSEETIVIFTGDHGDMLGERGLWYKMNWYEMSARVPMVVYAPNRYEPKRVKENVSTMDLLPTFVAMSGSSVQQNLPLDGVSLMPYIAGPVGMKTDTVLGEYMGEGTLSPLVMIRRGRWKFIYSPIDPPQLFDIEDDPAERVNLAAVRTIELPSPPSSRDPNTSFSYYVNSPSVATLTPRTQLDPYFTKALDPPSPPRSPSLHHDLDTSGPDNISVSFRDISAQSVLADFLKEATTRWDFKAITENVLESQRRRRLVHGALMQGRITTWEYAPAYEADKMYIRNQGMGGLDDTEWVSRWPRLPKA
ncbi:hypothetical protein MMC34_004315 [Xylographa carneopallida]|nr:hypothetical protein [Xylographa carneopallida]